jgi:hypothetical protein
VFSEVFLVQIHQNFGKYIPKFVFKAKKTSENAFRSLKLGAKMEIRGEKESRGVGRENFVCRGKMILLGVNLVDLTSIATQSNYE